MPKAWNPQTKTRVWGKMRGAHVLKRYERMSALSFNIKQFQIPYYAMLH